MDQIMNYVKPELIVVSAALYFIGMGIKKSELIPDRYIPLILGGIGIILCAVWVLSTGPLENLQDAAMAVFTAVIQGILVAGLSTYVNQIVKQIGKSKEICTVQIDKDKTGRV